MDIMHLSISFSDIHGDSPYYKKTEKRGLIETFLEKNV